ncbi:MULTISPECIES: DUF4944 domain-containing protein [Bacillus]|uniref:DUF4944 domain-containing protein n=1 Tax=Bacillus TaxID=1386 RepID=UPI0004065B5F|nr:MULTISPECIES: DUF4944 domain-containing protein [Bacillus]QHZ46067.1 DUF4944 domain-containing protein [Bacillus sp. NSP9.1]WFA06245.1 DUF4944 domain-containing protein [Bacillus sp. HSf4]
MKQEYKRPLLFASALLMAFCFLYYGGKLIGFYMTEYPKWTGKSADGNWEAVIKKSDNGYSGDLYWTGGEPDDTYLETFVVKFDDETALSSEIETAMSDYSGGVLPGGGRKEESVSFLENMEESEFDGRTVTVQLNWRQGKHVSRTEFILEKKTF